MNRREFLERTSAAGAVLTVGVNLSGCRREMAPGAGQAAFAPNAWIRVMSDGAVVVVVDRSEMGQGISTALPMLVAEELDADWSRVRFEYAPANKAYYNRLMGAQITGGSTSVRAAWGPLREAAARARSMLLTAAAAEWGVPVNDCRTEAGRVIHAASSRQLDYGALAPKAALLPVPETVPLKPASEFRLLGRPVPRLDLRDQVTGRVRFGVDVRPPDAMVAVVARCPVFGGTLRRFDPSRALAVPGVRRVLQIPSGVAVLATDTWTVQQGRSALELEWEEGELSSLDSQGIEARLRELARGDGRRARRDGKGAEGLTEATRRIEATFDLPYLAHACMEPMNCTALVGSDGVDVWVPTQSQAAPALFGGGSRGVAADIAGVPQNRVRVHTTNLGGGFGRRAETDFVAEAVAIARQVPEVPVRLVWTREDDIQHDFYRPASHHVVRAGLDPTGRPLAWTHHVVAPSIIARFIPGWVPEWVAHLAGPLKGGVDSGAVEGALEMPYAIPHVEVRYTQADLGVPVGFWRSVGHSHNAFVVECFIDEVAAASGQDPVQFRRSLLGHAPRHQGVLDTAAARAGWGEPLPPGRGRGIALHESFGSFCAQVAEVSVTADQVRVHRVTCAFDCGVVVNPDTIAAQLEGGIAFGLGAALKGRITIQRGRVVESNFHDYPVLRMDEMPVVETHIMPSSADPGGVGEPGVPPIAPAVANAVFAVTGQRARRLPLALRTKD